MPDSKLCVGVGGHMKFETDQRDDRHDYYDSGTERVYRTPQRRTGMARVPTLWLKRDLRASEITLAPPILHKSDSLTTPRVQPYSCALVPVLHT